MLFVVRHAQTVWNLQGRLQGWRDSDLAPHAREDVTTLAAWLSQREISRLYCSDLPRAVSTCELLLPGLAPVPVQDTNLRECSYGDCEGLTDVEIDAQFPGIRTWRNEDRWLRSFPKGETLQQLFARVAQFLAERHVKRDLDRTQTLIVAHKGSMRAIVANLTETDPLRAMSLEFESDEVLQFSRDGRDLQRIRINA